MATSTPWSLWKADDGFVRPGILGFTLSRASHSLTNGVLNVRRGAWGHPYPKRIVRTVSTERQQDLGKHAAGTNVSRKSLRWDWAGLVAKANLNRKANGLALEGPSVGLYVPLLEFNRRSHFPQGGPDLDLFLSPSHSPDKHPEGHPDQDDCPGIPSSKGPPFSI